MRETKWLLIEKDGQSFICDNTETIRVDRSIQQGCTVTPLWVNDLPQVSPSEFVSTTKGKLSLKGKPAVYSVWPTEEQA